MGSSEVALRLSSLRAGVRVTLALAVAAALYLAATPHGPHRAVLFAIPVLAAADALAIARFAAGRVARTERRYVQLVMAWNLSHAVAVAVACTLDGGIHSPLAGIFFVSVAFAAASLPPRPVAVIAAADIALVLLVAALDAQWTAGLIFQLPALASIAALATSIAHARGHSVNELRAAKQGTIQRLARVIEYRDNETGEHTERMSAYCAVIARRLGWPEDEVGELQLAATMHDVGKVAVPDAVLLKPGPLSPPERAVMERHTVVGHEMLSGSHSRLLQLAATIALTHHERVDGEGYPHRLRGDQIPLAGRIVAVADVFDALTSDRVYRGAMPVEQAVRILTEARGTQFDPDVLDAFERGLGEVLEIRAQTISDAELLAA
jgi:HD-GYP domain-containing protein (c-di-GMP phosphodiesterase class II)